MNTDVQSNMVFCRGCGKQIHHSAVSCPNCGAVQSTVAAMNVSVKRILPAMLLCFFFGWLGVHRFYVGKVGTGILQLLTFGGLGIWALIDFIVIVVGGFRDAEGHLITLWT